MKLLNKKGLGNFGSLKIVSFVALLILVSVFASARMWQPPMKLAGTYDPDWEVSFTNTLSGYRDTFDAGAGPLPATDGYELKADVLQPGGPPTGPYIQMRTLVDGKVLTADYRSLSVPETWEMTLVIADPAFVGLSGTNTLTWDMSQADPSLMYALVDYGTDSSRTTPVTTTDLGSGTQYIFTVASPVTGPYRYFDLIASVPSVNTAPVLDPVGNQVVSETEPLTIQLTANDAENDTLTYSIIESLPSTYSFNTVTGQFDWTPQFGDEGSYPVTFIVSDGSLQDNETIIITVDDLTRPICNPADINGDGNVDWNDLQLLQQAFNIVDYCGYADTNQDGVVDAYDYITLKTNYGASTGWCRQLPLGCAAGAKEPPVAELEEINPVEDSDNDGIQDEDDLCPDTKSKEVDEDGCSAKQFCRSFEIESRKDYKPCRKLDWKDNEKNPKDCRVVRNKKTKGIYCTNRAKAD